MSYQTSLPEEDIRPNVSCYCTCLVATKANLSEEVKIWERRPAPPALSDPDGSEKGQTLPTGF